MSRIDYNMLLATIASCLIASQNNTSVALALNCSLVQHNVTITFMPQEWNVNASFVRCD